MSRRRRLLLAWLGLLSLSHFVWLVRDRTPPLPAGAQEIQVREYRADGSATGRRLRLVFRDLGRREPDAPVVLLLHGSPGGMADFDRLAAGLTGACRVIVPDLPGFGASRALPADLSIRTHARQCLELLDALEVQAVHAVGFSMGGGVALHLAELAPERVRSLVLLGAIGVQEMELFGSHRLNHAVHQAQLLALRAVRWLTPHFGFADEWLLNVPYARNFVDSDQRPLRGILRRWAGPALIVHGKDDFLVPVQAALEHHRLMPQSELELVPGAGHFLPWTRPHETAAAILSFVDRVEDGRALTRDRADPARTAEAQLPFDPSSVPAFAGPALLLAVLLIAAATLVSEDLTCIGTGLLVAQGRIGFPAGVVGCFLGILGGDVLLYLLGRLLGRRALARPPMRWWIRPAAVERASAWFRRMGWRVVLACRFLPGLRVPTYFAAGALRTPFRWFLFYFVLAVAAWTPLLVGGSALLGGRIEAAFHLVQRHALPALAGLALALFLLLKLLVPLCSWRGRRGLVGAWRRWTRFEFWPRWLVYLPLAPWFAWLALRHRGLRVVTAVNPAIPLGGLVGESKAAILAGLGREDPRLARWTLLPPGPAAARLAAANAFLAEHDLDYPIVLKPDAGERGRGVEIVGDPAALERRLTEDSAPLLLQEYVDGPELGVFFIRRPDEEAGRIVSVTEKRLPRVIGDGRRTLEELILADPRAVAMARVYLEENAARLDQVPAAGEEVSIARVGAHSRGALFLDGRRLLSPETARGVADLGRGYAGFHYGRFDLRLTPDGFRVLELNGLTSEPTHIYDPDHGAVRAWRDLARCWAEAWAIGRLNVAAGACPAGWGEILKSLLHRG
ncbi:MAG: alpha/beta fold hydrolase [Planctomycetota bacterium]|nr:MAG: alpha/beta fold hydrolase [Planctomycetota bacterium]